MADNQTPADSAKAHIEKCKRDYAKSELDLATTIDDLRARKPSVFDIGEDVLHGLSDANVGPLSDSQYFESVTERVLKGVERKSGTLSVRVASGLLKITPLARLALGVTSFAGDVRPCDFT